MPEIQTQNPNAPQMPNINMDVVLDSPNLVCECGGKTFHPTYVVKKVSQFLTNTGKNEYVPVDVFVCDKCGKIMTDLMPEHIAKKVIGEDDTPVEIENEEVK